MRVIVRGEPECFKSSTESKLFIGTQGRIYDLYLTILARQQRTFIGGDDFDEFALRESNRKIHDQNSSYDHGRHFITEVSRQYNAVYKYEYLGLEGGVNFTNFIFNKLNGQIY